jgi:hypothetical protein
VQDEFPTFSRVVPPDRYQSSALARIAHRLGFRRLGILSSVEAPSVSMHAGVELVCRELGMVVVGTVTAPTGINRSSSVGQTTMEGLSYDMSVKFGNGKNVKIFVLATADVNDGLAILTALNASGIIGPGVVVLIPSSIAGVVPADIQRDLLSLLNGSIAVFPDVYPFSTAGEDMWAAWPKTMDNWTSLLAQTPQSLEYRTIAQPTAVRSNIGVKFHYTWDATVSSIRRV